MLLSKPMPQTRPLPAQSQPEPRRRRVLAVVRWPVGGIRTYLLYHCPLLQDAGFRFTFVGPADKSYRAFCDEVASWEGVEFEEAPMRGRECSLRPVVRKLLRSGRFEVVHSHGLGAAAQVALANLGLGTTHVISSHDVFRKNQFPGLLGRAQLWLLGRLLARADAIVSVSEDAQANLLDYLPSLAHARCRLVPILAGIDTSRFGVAAEAPTPSLRERLQLDADVCLMGFLGRFMEQKGFLPFLEALEQLRTRCPAGRFHLAAIGSGDFKREYRGEVERRGLHDCITFLDFVPDIGPVLQQLDLLVMPSLWEACGLLAIEALASGVPVLGSDCIGLREVLRGTPARMAPVGDADAWARALEEAIARPWFEDARGYAVEARRRFDVAHSARRLCGVFEEVLGWSTPGV
jgi:glycosyltransferase involved in cell wall biosynthesis